MKETRNYCPATRNYADHSTFGGLIYEYDFDGYNSMSNILDRIISDMKFDKKCRLNVLNRNRNKKFKKEGK